MMSSARRWSSVIGGAVAGFLLAIFALALASKFESGWLGAIISPGSALTEFLDRLWPVHNFGVSIERAVFGSLLINASLYALLAYVPINKLVEKFSPSDSEAFWVHD